MQRSLKLNVVGVKKLESKFLRGIPYQYIQTKVSSYEIKIRSKTYVVIPVHTYVYIDELKILIID